ncbi:MAG: PAS domain S-box protein [Rhodocyclaceae bacterium]|nr:PAS domain S-box protein [Rhodocyclaceae bacterium]
MTNDAYLDKTSLAPFLRLSLILIAGGCTAFLLVFPFIVPAGHSIRALGAVLLLATCGASALAFWRNQVAWALRLLLYGSWLSVTVMCILSEGIRSPIAFAYPLIIMLAGWQLGRRMAIVMGLLSLVAGLAMALATTFNILHSIPPAPPLFTWLVQAFVLVVTIKTALLVLVERDEKIGNLQRLTQEIREQNAFHETLVKTQSDAGLGMFIILSGRIAYANDALCHMTGYTQEEIRSLPSFLDLVHPDDRDRVSRNLQRRLNKEKFQNSYRISIFTKKQDRREVEMTVAYMESERVPRVLVVMQDVTERLLAEAALSQTEEKFTRIFQASPVAISLATVSDGTYLDVNPAFARFFGWTRQELVGHKSSEIGLWKSPEERQHWVNELRGGGQIRDLTATWYNKAGEERICQLSADTVEISGETCILGMTFDVTDRVRAEEALKSSQARLVEAQRIGHFGSWELDLASRMLTWSDEISSIFETTMPSGTVSYETTLASIHPEDRAPFDQAFVQTIAEGKSNQFTYRLCVPDGRIKFVHVRAETLLDADGKPVKVIGTTQDITEQQLAQQEIHHLNAELEIRVQERTAELQSANKELESFAYSISHDLRAPLRGIDGFSHLLAEEYGERLDAQGKSYLERVRAAAQRMGHLIDDILELSRVSRHSMRRSQVDLSRLAGEILDELRQGAPTRAPTVSIAEGCTAFGDPQLLRVLMQNLLENAWKYSSRKAAPTIEFGRETPDGEAVFFVRDNGVGFDMKYADRLFTPFQRLHKPEEFEGTGIGLATVARIVHRHGGRVWAESEPGKGTTLRFTLAEAGV